MHRPLLLGHRGARASHEIPENTLASFELCLEHGCDGFEFDVRRSADGQAVICHDPQIRGMEIAQTSVPILALPTLDEVLGLFASRAFLDIELKVGGLEQEIISLLHKHSPSKGYVVSSFLPQVLVVLRDLDRAIPLGFIFDEASQANLWEELAVDWVMPQANFADLELIGRMRSAGKKTMVWTVNDEDRVRGFAESGVDAIISDATEQAARVWLSPEHNL
jgi:glycerophosphoryl diester phosphodiesterase